MFQAATPFEPNAKPTRSPTRFGGRAAAWSRRVATVGWLLAVAGLTLPAQAQDATSTTTTDTAWQAHWRRSAWPDYALTGVGFAVGATLELIEPASEPHWRGPILFDRAMRNTMVAGSSSGRNRAALISDLALWGSIGHVVLDATLVSMVAHRSPELGYEMLWMDAEAYAMTMLLNSVAKRLAARERPDTEACQQSSDYDRRCSSAGKYESFYSGHAALSATSAGLLCAHHQHLDLYGGAWDGLACASAIAVTSVTGGLRIVADRHWGSDVLVGHVIGFATGYFLPTLLHYRPTPPPPTSSARFGLFPQLEPAGGGLQLVGVF